MDDIERNIYSLICSHEGIKAKDIGRISGESRQTINQYLYGSPYIKELCYQDKEYRWHGLILQSVPHYGIEDFCGYYSWVREFLDIDFEEFLERLKAGCRHIGRNLNDTRGLFHSFEDTYDTMQNLFGDLMAGGAERSIWDRWEILFELRIKRSRSVRIYADVILVTDEKVFSLEFKMKDENSIEELEQAAKYSEYLEVLFGPGYDVIPALVLTTGVNIYEDAPLKDTTAVVPVCSGDRLHCLVKDYCGIL
ncbi:helix-turn-helix domain containing protein [Dorea sp. D27]|uniref:helix-turn-helix domain containing protein n=1 Tax=Dorea sp. D27 TaxID=658665 RepID=UPI0006A204F6|nr:helix-turn-helix domain containing protein [Dorea sp. D27]KMZ52798.1 hypothetical protein HMPREF0980_03139 [Dorea sp. D27]